MCFIWFYVFLTCTANPNPVRLTGNSLYSMVPNNSAARLLIFKIFALPTRLIWTYTLIKIQIIFLPTRLLSTILFFFIYFQCFLQPFFVTIASKMLFFSCIFILLLVSRLKFFWNWSKKCLHIYDIPTYLHDY